MAVQTKQAEAKEHTNGHVAPVVLADVLTDVRNAIKGILAESKNSSASFDVNQIDAPIMAALAVKGFRSILTQKRSSKKQLARKRAERGVKAGQKMTSAVIGLRV